MLTESHTEIDPRDTETPKHSHRSVLLGQLSSGAVHGMRKPDLVGKPEQPGLAINRCDDGTSGWIGA